MAWYLNRALTNMRNEVNARYPSRDRTSDGTIGDTAHQNTNSDHNPDPDGSVDAWDMDVNLRSGNDAAAIEWLKARFQAHESSRYWIHNRTIASRDINNWQRRSYDGPNPHDKHVHWNTRSSHEDSNQPWGIEDMAEFNQTNFTAFLAEALDTPSVQAQFRQETVSYPLRAGYNLLSMYQMLDATVPALMAKVTTLEATVQALVNAINSGGGNLDLAALQTLLEEQANDVESRVRDAVADLGEGGAVKVRGPQD